MNLPDPSFNFKWMSDFKLINLTKTNYNFILSKLSSISDVPIASFIQKLEEIDNEHNKSSPSG